MTTIAGLDVGGAHLKVALVRDGKPVAVAQHLCPLWQGLDKLGEAFAAAAPMLRQAERFAVTMTGELSDLFDSRAEGVAALTGRIVDACGGNVRFWMGPAGFGAAHEAVHRHELVGSTNFLATATLVACRHADALLVDFGSTTADVVAIVDGAAAPRGLTDAARQRTGELIYTGLTRTAVMGVTDRVPFAGEWVGLAREYLATMADVRRILDELDDAVDLHATADGRGKSVAESSARLARMLGREARDGSLDDWRVAARFIAEAQMRSIHDGMLQVLSASPAAARGPLVAAGIGADVAAALALRVGMAPMLFGDLIEAPPACRLAATHSAAAVAVALLV